MVTKKQKWLKISAIFGVIFVFAMVLISMAVISFDIAKADDELSSRSDSAGFVAKEIKNDFCSTQQTNDALVATFNTHEKTLEAFKGDLIPIGSQINDGQTINLPNVEDGSYCMQIEWNDSSNEYSLVIFQFSWSGVGEYTCLKSADPNYHINLIKADGDIIDKYQAYGLYETSYFEISSSTEIPPQNVNITFDANGGKFSDGSSSMVIPEPYLGVTTIPAPGDVFYKDHLFEGWFDDYGNKFEADKVLVSMSGLTVYARWKDGCTITYHANGGEGDDIVTTVEKGTTVALNDGGSFTKEGQVLTGWDTSPDGTGTRYNVVENVVVNEGMDLYAYWTDVATCSFTVRIIGEAGYILAWDVASPSAYMFYNDDEYEFSPTGNNYVVQMKHNFVGSNEISLFLYSARGNKTNFEHVFSENLEDVETFISKIVVNGKTITWDDPVVMLNRNGEQNIIEFYDNGQNPVPGPEEPISAIFKANGGSWPSVNAEETTKDQNYLTYYKFPEEGLVKPDLHVRAWLDETAKDEVNKESVFEYMEGGHEFSALWAGYVTFDANGGEGTIDPREINEGADVEMYDGSAFKWDKHILKGWNTEADGSGTHYDFTDTFVMTGNVTLYAEWEEIVDPPTPPAPPTPGEDVESVNANAQTGDAIPVAVIAIVALGACGVFAKRKFAVK